MLIPPLQVRVIMASEGYPKSSEKGFPIRLPENSSQIFVAGAKTKDGQLLTDGGRVLGVTETARQIFHRKHLRAVHRDFLPQIIQLRLGKYSLFAVFKQIPVNPLHIVAVQKAQPFQTADSQQIHNVRAQGITAVLVTRKHRLFCPCWKATC